MENRIKSALAAASHSYKYSAPAGKVVAPYSVEFSTLGDKSEDASQSSHEWLEQFKAAIDFRNKHVRMSLEIAELSARVNELQKRSTIYQAPINFIESEFCISTQSIQVLIEEYETDEGPEYIASLIEANISVTEASLGEAISSLSQRIASNFKFLLSQEASTLGKMPTKQLQILSRFLVRR